MLVRFAAAILRPLQKHISTIQESVSYATVGLACSLRHALRLFCLHEITMYIAAMPFVTSS